MVLEAIRSLGIACRAWAAYPSDHPNVTRAVDAAQARVSAMLSAHGSVAIGVTRKHLRVGVWTLESAQARALAQALYARQVAVLRIDRGLQPEELRALVLWLAGPAVPLEPGSARHGSSELPERPSPPSPAPRLLGRSADGPGVRGDRSTGHGLAQRSPAQRGARVGRAGDAADWDSDQPATGAAAVPAELAMVGWLREFLKAQAARERGDRADADGAAAGTQAGAPGAGNGADASGTGGPRRPVE